MQREGGWGPAPYPRVMACNCLCGNCWGRQGFCRGFYLSWLIWRLIIFLSEEKITSSLIHETIPHCLYPALSKGAQYDAEGGDPSLIPTRMSPPSISPAQVQRF